ncbi:MAG: hypothetical protein QXF12_00885 [Candidatus Aenigmatarchaeota archaeon]
MLFGIMHNMNNLNLNKIKLTGNNFIKNNTKIRSKHLFVLSYNMFNTLNKKKLKVLGINIGRLITDFLITELLDTFNIMEHYVDLLYDYVFGEGVFYVHMNIYNLANHIYKRMQITNTIKPDSFINAIEEIYSYYDYLKTNHISYPNIYNNIASDNFSCVFYEENINNSDIIRKIDNNQHEIDLTYLLNKIITNIKNINPEYTGIFKKHHHIKIIEQIIEKIQENSLNIIYIINLDKTISEIRSTIKKINKSDDGIKIYFNYRLSLSHNFKDTETYYACYIDFGISYKLEATNKNYYNPIFFISKDLKLNKWRMETKYSINMIPSGLENHKITKHDIFFNKNGIKQFLNKNYIISTENKKEKHDILRDIHDYIYKNKMDIISKVYK